VTGKIFLKLIAGVLCLLLLSLVTVDYFATEAAKANYIENLTGQLAEKARMVDVAFSSTPPAAADPKRMAQAAGGRITLVAAGGRVLLESEANAAAMENHRSRPEVMAALAGRTGSSVRQSATLGIPFLYVAVPVSAGALRIAMPLSRIDEQVNELRWKILISTALAFLPAILLAAVLARFISRRLGGIMAHAGELARGNFRARLVESGNREFGQLERTLNETAANLQNTVEQLQREHTELEKLERIRKDFVINVSHELRTPLASIQGYTETLLDGAIDDPEHNLRFLGIIRHNAERLARLTADLLTLSRIEQKRQKFEFYPHDANHLIHDAVQLMSPLAEKKSIALAELPVDGPAEVCCDDEAVSQILSNLMDNAIKYTPEGGTITVGARRLDAVYMELSVRDTGAGIPAEDLPRLFERFYRVDKARSRELGGTGLGLSIVKHLVAAHNGTIRVESEPQRGSTFYFTLPVNEATLELKSERLNPEFTAS
jgi:two-component system, OmpR family, phosphate regulon sensor histidine kinase PhoR